jgi:hypothetical protein
MNVPGNIAQRAGQAISAAINSTTLWGTLTVLCATFGNALLLDAPLWDAQDVSAAFHKCSAPETNPKPCSDKENKETIRLLNTDRFNKKAAAVCYGGAMLTALMWGRARRGLAVSAVTQEAAAPPPPLPPDPSFHL